METFAIILQAFGLFAFAPPRRLRLLFFGFRLVFARLAQASFTVAAFGEALAGGSFTAVLGTATGGADDLRNSDRKVQLAFDAWGSPGRRCILRIR